ncbi:MAG: hypothetical protein JWO89_2814 [Verrucomicrobiaceae bacterium]|nr:hypothetical protein [Verrucomicrobiaceae bacterium]
MKNSLPLLLLPLAFTQCTWMHPQRETSTTKPKPADAVMEERRAGREKERSAYADGSADGRADAGKGAADDYSKHRGRFNNHTEQAYRDGYREGYAKGRAGGHDSALTAAQQATRDAGYAAGLRDRRMNRGADADSHAGTYDAKLSSWFLDGYQEGFEGR